MPRIHTNNFSSTLVTLINDSATTLIVADDTNLPSLSTGQTLNLTLRLGNNVEIVKVTDTSSSPSLTVVRAQEGTVAIAWGAGTRIYCAATRDSIDLKQDRGTESTLTIAGGVIAVTSTFHRVDTESAAASDDLDTINGGRVGDILVLTAHDSSHTVVVKDNTGNIKLSADMSLDHEDDTITLIYSATDSCWKELMRSDNT